MCPRYGVLKIWLSNLPKITFLGYLRCTRGCLLGRSRCSGILYREHLHYCIFRICSKYFHSFVFPSICYNSAFLQLTYPTLVIVLVNRRHTLDQYISDISLPSINQVPTTNRVGALQPISFAPPARLGSVGSVEEITEQDEKNRASN